MPFDRCRAVAALSTALVAALLCLAPAASAQADGTWSAPKEIGSGAVGFDMAGNAAGDVVAVWAVHDGSNWEIWVAERRAGQGTWRSAQRLVTGLVQFADPQPQVAVDGTGSAYAVWRESTGSGLVIMTTQSNAEVDPTTWTTASALSGGSCTGDAMLPRIAATENADAVAAWLCSDGGVPSAWAEAAVYHAGAWSGPTRLSANGAGDDSGDVQVGISGDGHAVASWIHTSGGAHAIEAARTDFWAWNPADVLAVTDAHATNGRPVIDSSGAAVVVWADGSYGDQALHEMRNPIIGSSWSSPVDVAGPDSTILNPQLAAAADGAVIAVWETYGDACDCMAIQSARRSPADGLWSTPIDAVRSASADEALIAPAGRAIGVAADGTTRVAWTQGPYGSTPSTVASAALGASDASWSTPAAIVTGRASEADPVIAVAADGSAVVAWTDGIGDVWASSYALAVPDDGGAVEKAARPTRIRWSVRASHGRLTIALGRPLSASFTAAPGTTYRITARSLARRVITGTCVKRAAKVRCSIRLPHAGRWLVQITPRKGGVDGTPARIRVRVRTVAPRPEPITG